MTEVGIFQDDRIVITNKRVMLIGKTYAVANVTTVATSTQNANTLPGVLIIIFGALVTLGSLVSGSDAIAGLITGIILIIVGAFYVQSQKDGHTVRISASGETNAISSEDGEYIARVFRALNDAIVQHG
jgi:membrane-bound ClpP family serine protease